jgi:glycosyltransferase involved in cell wall biosynthesis
VRVAIYRQQLFAPSEPFITTQASLTAGVTPIYAGTERSGPAPDGARFFAGAHSRLLQRVTRSNPPLLRWLAGERVDLVHAHFGMDAVYAIPLAAKLRVPLVTTFHGVDATASRRALAASRRLAWIMYLLKRSELREKGARFLCVSRFLEERVLALGFPRERVRVHYTGIDTAAFAPPRERPQGGPVLHVARLVEKKGTEDLLEAVSRLRGRHAPELVVIGDGPLRGRLEARARALGVAERVRFLGFRPQSVVREWLGRAALFCLPSRTARSGDAEGLGQVTLEAQAMEVPVVATRHGPLPEAVIDGATGILVPERDPDALAGALAEILDSPAAAAAMGRRGREHVLENFDAAVQGERLAELYRGVLAGG